MQTAPHPRLPNQVGSLEWRDSAAKWRRTIGRKKDRMDLGYCFAQWPRGCLLATEGQSSKLQANVSAKLLRPFARQPNKQPNLDPLGIEFLLELTRRSPRPGGSAAQLAGED